MAHERVDHGQISRYGLVDCSWTLVVQSIPSWWNHFYILISLAEQLLRASSIDLNSELLKEIEEFTFHLRFIKG